MPIIYEVGEPVELLVGDRWNFGARIAEAMLRRKMKRGDEYTYTVSAGPNKAWFNVGPSRIRRPTQYPTRRAVWTIQHLYTLKNVTDWFPVNQAFEEGSWNHALSRIMRIVQKRNRSLSGPNYRVFNYQTGEVIPLDILHLHQDN